jgi:hypothetical protein
MGAAELLTVDPLAASGAVACELLTKQRPLPDDVDGCRASVLKAQPETATWHASCPDIGSSDEANSSEQRNDETHRQPSMEAPHLAAGGTCVSRKLTSKAMSRRYSVRFCRAYSAALANFRENER